MGLKEIKLELIHKALGAQIISFDDFFYISPIPPNEPTSHRAGIPVIFPQFAEKGPLKKHGFVRNLNWELLSHEKDSHATRLHYCLVINSGDDPSWPYSARLDLKFVFQPDQLFVEMMVCNTGNDEFDWAGGLHPYFSVGNILECKVEGFENCLSDNKYDPLQAMYKDKLVTFNGDPYETLFTSEAPVQLVTPHGLYILKATGFKQWMVWNPGKAGAKDIYDLPNDDWSKFICIEPLIVSPTNKLNAGEKFMGTLTIEKC